MKFVLCSLVFVAYAAPTLAAGPSRACDAKRASIETQIAEAEANGRKREVAGLQKALRANKANCTDESLARDRAKAVQSAQREVKARERDLSEAESKGDAEKIAKRREKLDAARRELSEAEKPLPL